MALKGQSTTASYLEWNQMIVLLQKLERDQEYKFQLLIATGCYTGLRVGDLLQLKFSDVINKDVLVVTEGKTKKVRTIQINPELAKIVTRLHDKMNVEDDDQFMFVNRFGTKPINIQYVNRKLKLIAEKYKLNIPVNATSSHVFRKTLGRRVWSANNYSEKSLLLLSELFNHSSIAITKIYLGIKQEEIGDVYMSL